MPLFRSTPSLSTVWQRFRGPMDGFAFWNADGLFSVRVSTSADRAVDLFYDFVEKLPPAVKVAIRDIRSGKEWTGEGLALPDVRDEITRLKLVLGRYAGVEFAVYSPDDQVSLTAHLEVFIHSRTDRWLYVLLGHGLEQRIPTRDRSWRLKSWEFPPAPELDVALDGALRRLGLT